MADDAIPSDLINALAKPHKSERGFLLPIMREGDQLSLAVPGAIHGPYEAASKFMAGGYRPGMQDEQGVRNSADVAAAFAGTTAPRAAGEAAQSLEQQVARDRTIDALRLHMRTIGKDEAGWGGPASYLKYLAPSVVPTVIGSPGWMQAANYGMAGLAAGVFLKPHYDMVLKKRQYLRDMDERLGKNGLAE